MRVTNEQIKAAVACDTHCGMCPYNPPCKAEIEDYAADLLEARDLIKEIREDLLKISQYPIAFVCEEARIIAREAWKKSKEYAE